MPTSTSVSELVINKLTSKQYDALKGLNRISDTEIYITTDENESEISSNEPLFVRGVSNGIVSTRYTYDKTTNSISILKGTKAYYPNGFENENMLVMTYTFESNVVYSPTDLSGDEFIVFNFTTKQLEHIPVANTCTSNDGTTTLETGLAYLTQSNTIKKTTDTGATWGSDLYSFPLFLVKSSDSKIQQISREFQGYTYLGTTAFFKSGYKLRFPDGFNPDTNKPRYIETSLILNRIVNMTGDYSLYAELDTDDITQQYVSQCNNALVFQQEKMPDYRNTMLWYNPRLNYWMYTTDGGSTWGKVYLCYLTHQNHISGTYINSFNSMEVATNLTTNDMRLINHWNFPSNWRVNITPTNGGIYTAPGDGWFYLSVSREDGATDAYASITGWQTNYCVTSCCPNMDSHSSNQAAVVMQVSTGCSVIMNFSGTVGSCSFYYANGSYIVGE